MRFYFLIFSALTAFSSCQARSTLAPYNAYLKNLKTFYAHFLQVNPNGQKVEGDLYVQKPGQLRLIYDARTGIQLLADGKTLYHYDGIRKERDSMPLANTPLSFLLQAGDLEELAVVKHILTGANRTEILLHSKEDPEGGMVKLIFQSNPLQLKGWILTEPSQKITQVWITKLNTRVQFKPSTFQWVK